MLSQDATNIGESRYFLESENWEGCSLRSAYDAANAESNPKKWIPIFHEMIYNLNFLPAGRILRNSGRLRGSSLNCYHKRMKDSIEEIGQFLKEALILWSEGGGLGTSLSDLRPKGAPIMGKGGESSGPISFLIAADACANTIESGGSRRAAGLAEMFVGHPDIFNFIDAKMVDKLLSAFNISVGVNEKFIDAVRGGDDWNLMFNRQIYDTVKATDLWDKIIHNMWAYAEPGLLNLDNLRENNSYYFAPISGVNPCGEATLGDDEACDLGSLILPRFVSPKGYTNWQGIEQTIHTAVRFLDNILDVNKYVLDNIKQAATASRRIGLGYIGLAEYLYAKRLRYGSEDSLYAVEKLGKFVANCAYEASIKLAEEKGAFPKFDAHLYSKAKYVRKLPASIRKDIRQHGTRNVTLLAMPPTGTTSLLADCTSGIEPLYAKAYKRNDRVGERNYIHRLCKTSLKESWFVDSFDLTMKNHLDMQVSIQKFVDGSVSKTLNIPKEATEDDLSGLLLEYIQDLKGVTVYRDGSREEQILTKLTDEEIKADVENSTTTRTEADVQCVTGNCTL